MIRVGIHQINYFPWIGYFNKLAKSDVFVFLDDVQLADRGYSTRTSVISASGRSSYLNVGVDKRGHREKKFSEIALSQTYDWQERQLRFLEENYSKCKYFDETMNIIGKLFDKSYDLLIDVNMDSIEIVKNVLDIQTQTVLQSSIEYDHDCKKNDLMLELVIKVGGDVYLSGNGAKKYMDVGSFKKRSIGVQFLTFSPFKYNQIGNHEFAEGLSIIDMFFNEGLERGKQLFWDNIHNEEVLE